MDRVWRAGFVLPVLPASVSCAGFSFSHTTICYFLDGFLMIYCTIFTFFFFKEKFFKLTVVPPEEEDGTYQQLERPKDTDAYQVLEPTKKKKAAKKKKPEADQKDQSLLQPLNGGKPASAAQ